MYGIRIRFRHKIYGKRLRQTITAHDYGIRLRCTAYDYDVRHAITAINNRVRFWQTDTAYDHGRRYTAWVNESLMTLGKGIRLRLTMNGIRLRHTITANDKGKRLRQTTTATD